jgi:hypothetical protein
MPFLYRSIGLFLIARYIGDGIGGSESIRGGTFRVQTDGGALETNLAMIDFVRVN